MKVFEKKINRENQWYHFHKTSLPSITLEEERQSELFLPGPPRCWVLLSALSTEAGSAKQGTKGNSRSSHLGFLSSAGRSLKDGLIPRSLLFA